VNEKTGPVICSPVNFADWLSSLNAEFSELAPTITDVNVPVDNVVVTALLIETDRAPYVVKNPSYGQASGGQISLEVPWRAGTAVRTARRQDLLKLLLPAQELPTITVIKGGIVMWDEGEYGNKVQPAHWSLESQLYIEPLHRHEVVFPYHRQECFIDIGTQTDKLCVKLEMQDAFRNYRQIECTPTEAIVQGPGSVMLFGKLNETRLLREFS